MIRAAQPGDIGTMLRMVKSLVEESVFSKIGFDAQASAETLASRILREDGLALICEIGGAPAGMLTAHVGPYTFSRDLVAEDDVWYVLPWHRGSRAGLELLRAYFDWAKEKGAAEVCLTPSTGIEPEKTARFLQRMGMAKAGEIFKKEAG